MHLPNGKRVYQIASALDILPTLAKLTDVTVKTKEPIHGQDLTPLLFEKHPKWKERLIYNHWNGKTSIRSQKYRLDDHNRLYDMENDLGQTTDVSETFPEIADSLNKAKQKWLAQILLVEEDIRPLTLGHASYIFTQLPARDGNAHGNIKRSNKYPNDSFFTNWKSLKDSITWNVEVLEEGNFQVDLFYTSEEKNVGSTLELSIGNNKLAKKITEAYNPPLSGMENDRVPRKESYVKDFKSIHLGEIMLNKGQGTLTLKAIEIVGTEVVDACLLVFKKLDEEK